ncbi:MAG: MFS transporter [Anaerolineae bacterium]|nr:MFS transporter [Anaerolineae bacterium]MDW8072372.1 MFS transporter [Anaerolineae bacterium]
MSCPIRQPPPVERWRRTLYIAFLGQLVSAMAFSLIFPFLPLYVQYLGTRTGLSLEFWAGMAFSSQALTMALASPIWGALSDRYGRKLMLERAMFGGAVLLGLMAFVRSAEELALLRALQGLITGTISAANALVAGEAPRERIGYAMGLLQVGFWAGVAVGPLVGGALADLAGFRMPFLVTGALLFLSGLLIWLGVQEQFKPAASAIGRSVGFLSGWRELLCRPGIKVCYILRFTATVGQTLIQPVAPLFIQALLSSGAPVGTFTGVTVGLTSASSIGSALYLGRLGDRIGQRRVLHASLLAAALLYLLQSCVTNAWQFFVLQMLSGATLGGVVPTLSALLARYGRHGEEGNLYGLDNSISSAARAAAPILGAGIAMAGGLRATFAASGLLFLLSAVLASVALPRRET